VANVICVVIDSENPK